MERTHPPWLRRAALVVASLLVVAVIAGLLSRGDRSRVDEARRIMQDEARFGTTESAGLALLRVSTLLKEEGEACLGDGPAARCDAFFGGAGQSQVQAVHIVRCSRPQIYEVRASVLSYLDQLDEDPADVALPPLRRCP